MPEMASNDQSGMVQQPSGLRISEFIGKVLDQLSLSAWLPAAMMVGTGSLLIVVHGQRRLDVGAAVVALTNRPLGIVVVTLFALVLATMITQAFGYEAIRFLEGYWGPRANLVTKVLINRCVRRRARLEGSRHRLQQAAFGRARQRMIQDAGPRAVARIQALANILERITAGQSVRGYSKSRVEEAMAMGWRRSADPADLRLLDAIDQRLRLYPLPHRMLPTRLGNVLRAAEDALALADGGDVEGLVLRNYQRIPESLLTQHEQFRTRLDMYCTLVFVFSFLAGSSAIALWKFGSSHVPSAVAALALVLFAKLSYRAAVASATGYGSVLPASPPSCQMR